MAELNSPRFYDLYDRFVKNEISPEETGEFFELLKDPAHAEMLARWVDDRWDRLFDGIAIPAPVRPLYQRQVFRLAAAAVLLLIAGSLWLLTAHRRAPDRHIAAAPAQDLRPGSNKAVLILAGGSQVILDSTGKGQIAQQGGMAVTKTDDGRLAYTPVEDDRRQGREAASPVYNTLRTPRGGQYQLLLPDGTRVWLNAASSITFPTAFTGSSRRVTVTGEVYMEVTKDPQHPFFVSVNRGQAAARDAATTQKNAPQDQATTQNTRPALMNIEVLGTSFNIDAYDDEPAIRTTLLEGAVAVKAADAARTGTAATGRTLHPGQQAVLPAEHQEIGLASNVDPEEVLAWKNGLFQFNDADIRAVMRQLARWYDVEVKFEGEPPAERFRGRIPRDANASQVLHVLEKNNMHFRIEGKTIVVLP